MAVTIERDLTRHELVALDRLLELGDSPVGGKTLTRVVVTELERLGLVTMAGDKWGKNLWVCITDEGRERLARERAAKAVAG